MDDSDFSILELTKRRFGYEANAIDAYLDTLTRDECLTLLYDWEFKGRPSQQLPPGDWYTWLIRSGRGWGKTETGSNCCHIWAKEDKDERILLVGKDSDEIKTAMIEGPSGIFATAHPDFTPMWVDKKRLILRWPNGALAFGISAEVPEDIRSFNVGKIWWDEPFKCKHQEAVEEQLGFVLRIGKKPQRVLTSTPRATKLCKKLTKDPSTVVTNGATFQNYALSEVALQKMKDAYEGTRLGQQELYGEDIDENPNALWKFVDIVRNRKEPTYIDDTGIEHSLLEEMDRIVVAIDPPKTANENSDECGIVVAGKKGNDGYVFEDASKIATPKQWATLAIDLFKKYKADRIVAEVNNGGLMVEETLRNVNPNIPYKQVTATRGKAIRAEPIATLYEQGRIHHVGILGKLENQLIDFDPSMVSTKKAVDDRLDACVWALTELFGEAIKVPRIINLNG
jgi:phage terminase large subunit-like protein